MANIINEDNYNFKTNDIKLLDDMEYLTGPTTFAILKSETLNCTCITVGDAHVCTKNGFNTGNINKEIYLPEYLDMLFRKYPDKQFDLLVELQYTKNKQGDDFEYQCGILNNIYKSFKDCFKDLRDKSACSKRWPNVRFHALDIRYLFLNHDNENYDDQTVSNLTLIIKYWQKINSVNNLPIPIKTYEKVIQYIKINLNMLFILNKDDEFIDNFIDMVNKYYKFKRYMDSEYAIGIMEYIKSRLQLLLMENNIFTQFNTLENANDKNIENLNKFITTIRYFFLILGAIMFDYYMISRFLKIIKYGSADKNIIVIAGNYHIQNLEFFLQYKIYNFEYIIYKNKSIIKRNKYLLINNKLEKVVKILNLDKKYFEKINMNNYEVTYRVIEDIQLQLINNMDDSNFRLYKKLFSKFLNYKTYIGKYINDREFDQYVYVPENRYITIKSLEIENNMQ